MKFTSNQVEDLVYNNEVETIYGENRRWSRSNITIIKWAGKFYELSWEEGLTESQDNEFFIQDNEFFKQDAPEVICQEETIVINKWVKI
jgi:hypothetical protein